MTGLAAKLVAWHKRHGRHGMPWQGTRDPYRVWVSEIMLQQTRVATAIPYYERFLARFPDVTTLAAASLDEVMRLWAGLGYYSRARNLHRAAGIVAREHGGRFPSTFSGVAALPGVGRSTAGAILVFSRGARHAVLDGNVKRVLTRAFGVAGRPGEKRVAARLWALAEKLAPARGVRAYTQGVMDLGATVCTRTRPRCTACPWAERCVARRRDMTGALPGRKAPRALPRRRTTMVALTRAGEVLLEKRPPAGIWGGLWSLPEAAHDEDVAQYCERRFGVRVADVERLPPLAHAFTHFKLDILPLRARIEALEERAAEPGLAWLPLEDARGAAIPAPVRRILAGL
ncbi:MAG: A/G-specific adenine glycosylase [Burkholderiales bacterium]|nr:A/G-specific adenine glycosylase [Burkholderiales bacterium]